MYGNIFFSTCSPRPDRLGANLQYVQFPRDAAEVYRLVRSHEIAEIFSLLQLEGGERHERASEQDVTDITDPGGYPGKSVWDLRSVVMRLW